MLFALPLLKFLKDPNLLVGFHQSLASPLDFGGKQFRLLPHRLPLPSQCEPMSLDFQQPIDVGLWRDQRFSLQLLKVCQFPVNLPLLLGEDGCRPVRLGQSAALLIAVDFAEPLERLESEPIFGHGMGIVGSGQ